MAELKLSAIWEIQKYAQPSAQVDSDELTELRHRALSGVTWEAFFEGKREDGLNRFAVCADFARRGVKSVWANINATLLGPKGDVVGIPTLLDKYANAAGTYEQDFVEFSDGRPMSPSVAVVFETGSVNDAVRKDGSLHIRIDLTILKVGELLKCRKLLRGLLTNKTQTDFDVKVGDESFKLHKSILAGTSGVFARMFESGMEEAADGVLTLPDTTPAAFKAFTEAIYFDNWNFLSDIDLTQDVLHLAEKFGVDCLKQYCDESLAVKVNDANALEILIKSAALCNAEKTKAACVAILADGMEFKESDVWLDFKKRNRGVALEIMDAVSALLFARVKVAERERDVANAVLKRKCDEEKEKASSSKRRAM